MYVKETNAKNHNREIFSRKETIKITEITNNEIGNKLPKPRAFKSVEINFTPRHFTTPSRESTKADEDEVNHYAMTLLTTNVFYET